MPLTPEARAEINRKNAAKSTGPKSAAGKKASRRNALKHGLRAAALAMPDEDPADLAARAEAWDAYYRPASPGARHLVDQCVRAALLADRVARHHDAVVLAQVAAAERDWDRAREDEVHRLNALLPREPAAALRLLLRTGHGCRSLLSRWYRLLESFAKRGCWTAAERDEAILLQGSTTDLESLRSHPAGYTVRLLNAACGGDESDATLPDLCDPRMLPEALRDYYGPECYPERKASRRSIVALVEGEVKALNVREAYLGDLERPERSGMKARALVIQDAGEARRYLRYHAESRTSFHRAYAALEKTLRRDAEEGPWAGPLAESFSPNEPADELEAESFPPNEPIEEPEAGSLTEAISPNEPAAAPEEAPPAEAISPNEPAAAPGSPAEAAEIPAVTVPTPAPAAAVGRCEPASAEPLERPEATSPIEATEPTEGPSAPADVEFVEAVGQASGGEGDGW